MRKTLVFRYQKLIEPPPSLLHAFLVAQNTQDFKNYAGLRLVNRFE